MFLGTSRTWWIMTGVTFVLGLVLLASDLGGAFGTPVGVLLVFLAMGLFAAAPRRRRESPTPSPPENIAPPAPEILAAPPRPRPTIDARDAGDV